MNSAYRSRREHIEKKTKQSKKLARKTKLLRKKPFSVPYASLVFY
jgi:hypothetical protein